MKFVKASERLPHEFKLSVIARYCHTKTILYDFREFVSTQPQNLKIVEWLDESEPSPEQDELWDEFWFWHRTRNPEYLKQKYTITKNS